MKPQHRLFEKIIRVKEMTQKDWEDYLLWSKKEYYSMQKIIKNYHSIIDTSCNNRKSLTSIDLLYQEKLEKSLNCLKNKKKIDSFETILDLKTQWRGWRIRKVYILKLVKKMVHRNKILRRKTTLVHLIINTQLSIIKVYLSSILLPSGNHKEEPLSSASEQVS